ncbi:MAG: Crp/Fnr family transcriptional regulator [Burkholderiaceae bacterium]
MPKLQRSPPPLDEDVLRAISALGGVRRYPANAVIIHEGEEADSLYIVLSGRVRVYASNEAGKEFTIITHGPGEYVGELALDGGVRTASVMTQGPTTCSVVSGANLRQFIATHPDFALHLIHKLIWRLRHATDSVKSLALQDVHGRVAHLLEDLAVTEGDARVVPERLTHQAIAERVGSSREMVTRIFKDLATGGFIAVEGGRIVLLKPLPSGW